jgi:soluble lytic murein transglycosylase-like protein
LGREKISDPLRITPSIQQKFAVAMQNYEKLTDSVKSAINDLCAKFEIPRELAIGICIQESKFDSKALSTAGAIGFMQLMPGTIKGIKNFITQPPQRYA